jgi:methyl-accepting chemotaxis protein
MGEINASSRKIADIIATIDAIAFQTNLLALNAAVEAARAGEQGRGFAVVASEVRNLAQRSAAAAKEIKALIQDSVAKVGTGSELVNRSGQTLEEIVAAVRRVTDIIAEIAAASQAQSTGLDQVNRAVTQMDQVVHSNAAQTEELSSTAQSLSTEAAQLQALVGRFKLDTAPPPVVVVSRVPAAAARPAIVSAERGLARRPASPPLAAATGDRSRGDAFEEF